jgi:hypothetical protein
MYDYSLIIYGGNINAFSKFFIIIGNKRLNKKYFLLFYVKMNFFYQKFIECIAAYQNDNNNTYHFIVKIKLKAYFCSLLQLLSSTSILNEAIKDNQIHNE